MTGDSGRRPVQDPSVIAEQVKRAGARSKQKVAEARAVFDADIAEGGQTGDTATVIQTLKTALLFERRHTDLLRDLLDGERKGQQIDRQTMEDKEAIIRMLIETCRRHEIELPPSLMDGPVRAN